VTWCWAPIPNSQYEISPVPSAQCPCPALRAARSQPRAPSPSPGQRTADSGQANCLRPGLAAQLRGAAERAAAAGPPFFWPTRQAQWVLAKPSCSCCVT
jgi:hypothetical protein